MREKLQVLLKPVIEALGYELVGVEYQRRRGNDLLRLYIDKETGVGLDDCQRVSHQVSGVLDVEDPLSGHYTLEVSSPGLDRPLFELAHYQRFAGQQVKIQLYEPLNGRRKLNGLLRGVRGSEIIIHLHEHDPAEADDLRIPLERIEKARLVPDL